MSILIVDDSLVSRTLIADLLKEAGYTDILLCDSVEKAFQVTHFEDHENIETTLNLILLDINLPGISGLEACHLFSQHTSFCDVPIIIISGIGYIEGLDAAFAAGAVDYITKPPSKTELLARVRSALRLNAEMNRRKDREAELLILNQRLEEVNLELEKLSATDPLTGLANRRSFNEFIHREWLREQRSQRPFSVVMIDIDYFKKYNDYYGHLAGDACLQKVAIALQATITRASDFWARFGGEEFVAVLPNIDREGAQEIAAMLLKSVEQLDIPHAESSVADHVTISVGIASVIPNHGTTPENVIAMADEALYKAKDSGRNQSVIYGDYSFEKAYE